MADDQVKYSDLFDAGIDAQLQKLTAEITTLKDAIAAAKQEANGLRDGLRGAGTATRDQQQSTAADAAAVEALNRQVKDLTDKLAKLEEKKKRYKKLTDEEVKSVEDLRQALQGSEQEQIKAVQAIDIQAKSYNELNAIYNELKTSLNAMTVAERENTAAGKEMVNRAKEIRDVMNNLQQQTGNYALNVGNYMSAMNGLQMQTQQILREIPSAQNLSQFFLAISNNIPMFTDALARYNKGLPEIKAKLAAVTAEITRQEAALAGMNAQSTEYAAKQAQINELRRQEQQLQSASVSGWRAILKSVGSWQTLLIAGLLLLRKIPDIIKWIKERWDRWVNGVREVKNEMNSIAAIARMQADVIKKTADEVTELKLIVERLKDVKQGTDEWAAGVATVNEITKANLDTTKATPAEVEKVTQAYIKQAQQLAKNAVLTDMIAKSQANQSLREVAYRPGTYGTARQALGLEIDSKDEKEFRELFDKMNQAVRDYNNKVRKKEWRSVRDAAGNMTMKRVEEAEGEAGTNRRKEMNDAIQDYRNFINKRLEILSPDAIAKLEAQYEIIDPLGSGKGNKNRKQPKEPRVNGSFNNSYNPVTMADVMVEEAKAMRDQGENVLVEIQMWYDKKVAIAEASYTKQIEVLQREKADRERSLTENLNNARIFVAKYDDILAQLDKDHAAGNLDDDEYAAQKAKLEDQLKEATDLIESEKKQRQNITDYYNQQEIIAEQKKNNELADLDQQRTDKLFKEEEKRFKAFQDAEKRKFELEKHNSIERAKFDMEQEIASKQWQIDHAKELQLSEEQLAILQEEVEWLNKKYNQGNYNAKRGNTGNYSNIMDVLFGEKITNDQISALNSVFDQAKEALNSWMDARKAAADQAKELADDEVSAAENALNREIELRNQGYANDVALREKELADAKEKQKQAVELQAKYKKEQVLLDAAMQASSMITASANIMKQFPNPALWIPMLATLWGTFAYAKVKSYQSAEKSITFGEGGSMLLEGGSHASGHDINLGVGPDGSNLRAEGGEYFAVINKRSSRKYGSQIPAVVNALNSGMFEDRYIKTSDAVGLLPQVIRADNGSYVDLSKVEGGVSELVKQGEQNWTIEGGYRVLRYKNLTRRVKIG